VGVDAPDAEVVVGGRLFAVLDLRDLGTVPTCEGGKPRATEPGVLADIPQSVAECLPRLIDSSHRVMYSA
jgi:hypothetical protein